MIFTSATARSPEPASHPDWVVRARSGHAVITDETGRDWAPERIGVPAKLVDALHEWARVAESMRASGAPRGGDEADRELLSQRGRQLARLLALETDAAVGYVDPSTGAVRRPGRPRATRISPERPRAEPTPWATGLAVSGMIAGIVLIVLFVVSLGLSEVSWWLAAGVNVAVVAGFAPSVWLGRRIPVWRWVAFGTGGGIVLAWIALLFSALG